MLPTIPNNHAASPIGLVQGISEQNRELVRPVAQMDQHIQEAQERMLQVVFEVGFKIGEGAQTLRLEKLQLESEKRKLEGEITQLNLLHVSELNNAVDGLEARNKIFIEKVKSVAGMFDLFTKTYPNTGFPSTDASWFTILYTVISKVNYDGLRKYPEYQDYRQNKLASPVIAAPTDALILRQNLPFIQGLNQQALGQYDALKAESHALRTANLALIDKKEVMADYHKKYIEEMKRQDREFRYLKILKEVQSVYDRIKWELPPPPPTQVWSTEGFYTGNGYWKTVYTTHPIGCLERLKEIQEAVKGIILTLEGFTKGN